MSDYDLIVIGAGPGGYTAALRAAELGMRTAVVEKDSVGGTCLNRGCVPTKTLLHASETLDAARGADVLGVLVDGVRADLPRMFARKDEVVQTLRQGVEGLLKRAKVDVIAGEGRIVAPDAVQVAGQDGPTGSFSATHILAATGSAPARPPIPGLDLPGVLTSDDLLEGADRPYGSIAVIGGGVIGAEFATFYAELGTRVTVIEGLDRMLPGLDRELGQSLAAALKARGAAIHTKSMVRAVEKGGDGLVVRFATGDEEQEVSAEVVLCAVGRVPYWKDLFAEGVEPQTAGRALKVDERFATSVDGVYAIGDVSSPVQLAHVAAAQGTACVEMLAGMEPTIDLSVVPSCVYCRPEIASVGLSEAEAKDAGMSVKVGKAVMGGNARTVVSAPGRSFMKVVGEEQTGRIVGAQLMCTNASDMVSQLSMAIANRLTASDLLRAMRPHPTYEESLTDALRALAAKTAR